MFRVIMLLTGGNESASHVNLHHLLMALILSTPYFEDNKQRLLCLIHTICFVSDDDWLVAKCDFDYLFQLAYIQISLITSLTFENSEA